MESSINSTWSGGTNTIWWGENETFTVPGGNTYQTYTNVDRYEEIELRRLRSENDTLRSENELLKAELARIQGCLV